MLNSRPPVSQPSPVAAQRCATGAGLDGDPGARGTIGSAVPVRPRQPTAYTAATHRRRVLLNIRPESPTVSAEDPLFLGAGTVLMGPHNGAVDHRIFVVGI